MTSTTESNPAAVPHEPRIWPKEHDVHEALARRPTRPIPLDAQNRALRELAEALTRADANVLQKLVEKALELCCAHSAGVSIIEFEGDQKIFRWRAVAGRWSHYFMGFMPRDLSPCGIVVDRHAPQVMPNPDEYFPAMLGAVPLAKEALLVPFDVLGETVGTVWVVSHDENTRFTAQDLQVLQSLAPFAAAAHLALSTLQKTLAERDEFQRTIDRLRREAERISTRA